MRNRQRGFSLIEALVSVVLLSTGLLGLVHLQARLWSVSGDLHSSDEAYLLAGNSLEKFAIEQLFAVDLTGASTAQRFDSATRFVVNLSLTEQAQVAAVQVRVEWAHQSGLRSLDLATAIYTNSRPSDNRLLLAAD